MSFSVLFDSQQLQQSCQCSKWGLRVTLVPILFNNLPDVSSALNYEFTKLIEPSLQDNMQRAYDCLIGERVRLIHLLKFKHPCITIDTLVFALVAADNSLSACLSWPLYILPVRNQH